MGPLASAEFLKTIYEFDVAYDLEKCVHQLFEAQASQTPDAVAMVAGNVRLSYRELSHVQRNWLDGYGEKELDPSSALVYW